MGTWGNGNFDSDTAADHLSILAARLLEETKTAMAGKPVELEASEYWGVAVPCNVELMALLAEQQWVGAMVPDLATVRAWEKTYLAIWDASIDGLGPSPKWKAARRAILVATFDRLAKASEREEPSVAVAPKAPTSEKPTAKRSSPKKSSAKKAPIAKSSAAAAGKRARATKR